MWSSERRDLPVSAGAKRCRKWVQERPIQRWIFRSAHPRKVRLSSNPALTMFRLTSDEIRLVVALLAAVVVGATAKHCRDTHRAANPQPIQQERPAKPSPLGVRLCVLLTKGTLLARNAEPKHRTSSARGPSSGYHDCLITSVLLLDSSASERDQGLSNHGLAFCLLKFATDLIQESAGENVRDFRRRGLI
jgi:hypothetical protein